MDINIKKEQILEMLYGLEFPQFSKLSIETEGRALRLISSESEGQCLLQVPLQEDYPFDVDLSICNIVLNINDNYFKDDPSKKSVESQEERIDLIFAILEDLNFSKYFLETATLDKKEANNVRTKCIFYSGDVTIKVSSNKILIIPSGEGIAPCYISLSDNFSYSVLANICSFILIMAKRIKEDYDYLNNVSQWI